MQVLAHVRPQWRIYALILALALVGANIFIWRSVYAPRELEAHALLVGKGDAVLVRTPSGRTLLIDTGPDAGILRALGEQLPFGTHRIDAVIETSSAHAAVGGLPEVEERYEIGTVYRVGDLMRGDVLQLGRGVSLTILYPDRDTSRLPAAEQGMVARLAYGNISFLIEENISLNTLAWLSQLDAADGMLQADMTIASTSAGDYRSNGEEIR